ncbi:cerebellin-3 [Gasterosteus aculeatus]
MRAVVLLSLLHGAFCQNLFSWDNGASDTRPVQPDECLPDPTLCGCCLMQKKLQRMEWFFNKTVEEISKNLTNAKMALNDKRASRSAFSVALDKAGGNGCFGPFADDRRVLYRHVFLNLGDGYGATTGGFTAPRSGVYSLAVTVYSAYGSLGAGAHLTVNGLTASALREKESRDREDSATLVVSVKLKAGDEVAVVLPKGSVVCDDSSHLNTFTGFLLYPC